MSEYLPRHEHTDPLTDLPNRRAIHEYLTNAIDKNPEACALLELDVYGFKGLNDTYGHHEGDLFLETIGAVLREVLRLDDVCIPGHKSGDEFCIILGSVRDEEALAGVRERVRQALDDYGVEISIGGRMHRVGESTEELCIAADELMRQDRIERKREQYNASETHRAIREIARLALANDISPRDLPTLIQMSRDDVL